MKFKTSMKICYNFEKVWSCYAADVSNIFDHVYLSPNAYNCGVYGWNCDIYIDYNNNQIITSGYRNTRGKRIPKDFLKLWKDKVDRINSNFWSKKDSYKMEKIEKHKEKMQKLAQEFLSELSNLY